MRKRWCGILLLTGVCLALAAGAPAGETPMDGAQINLSGTSLEALLEYVGRIEGKPVILGENFPREEKVDMITPGGVSVPAHKLGEVVGTILRQKGFALVSDESVLQVVPVEEALEKATQVVKAEEEIPSGISGAQTIIRIVALNHVQAPEVAKAVEALKSKDGQIAVAASTNQLIISDNARSVERMVRVARELDKLAPKPVTAVRQLQYARVEELAPYITQYNKSVVQPRPGQTGRVQPTMTADPRRNAVVLMGTAEDVADMQLLLDELDREGDADYNYYVYRMKNGQADQIAPIVTAALQKIAAGTQGPGRPQPTVVPDPSKNLLVISALPDDHRDIMQLLEALDGPVAQVYIEAAIVEMGMDAMMELGVELATADNVSEGETRGFGATTAGASAFNGVNEGLGRTPLPPAAGMVAGIWHGDYTTIPLLVRASEQNADVDILALPTLTATDHTPASISIEERRPYEKITYNSEGDITGRTFGGKHVAGVQLQITPHVMEHKEVRLDVNQNASEFLSSAQNPPTTDRSAITSIRVPDGKTAIIGGLTKTRLVKSISGVPFLCRVPVLGTFFRTEQNENVKRNLCLFITPHVIDTHADMETIMERRGAEHRRLQQHREDKEEWLRKGGDPNAFESAVREGDVDRAARLLDDLQ